MEFEDILHAPQKVLSNKKIYSWLGIGVGLVGIAIYFVQKPSSSSNTTDSIVQRDDSLAVVSDQIKSQAKQNVDNANNSYMTQLAQYKADQKIQDAETKNYYESLLTSDKQKISDLTNYFGTQIANDKQQIMDLNSQINSANSLFKANLESLQSQLNNAINNQAKQTIYVQAPSSPVYSGNVQSGSSENTSFSSIANIAASVVTPVGQTFENASNISQSTQSTTDVISGWARETRTNDYNINPVTNDYSYGGVDYSSYTGTEDQIGSAMEDAYWNNFINGG